MERSRKKRSLNQRVGFRDRLMVRQCRSLEHTRGATCLFSIPAHISFVSECWTWVPAEQL